MSLIENIRCTSEYILHLHLHLWFTFNCILHLHLHQHQLMQMQIALKSASKTLVPSHYRSVSLFFGLTIVPSHYFSVSLSFQSTIHPSYYRSIPIHLTNDSGMERLSTGTIVGQNGGRIIDDRGTERGRMIYGTMDGTVNCILKKIFEKQLIILKNLIF